MKTSQNQSLKARTVDIWRMVGRVDPFSKSVLAVVFGYPLLSTFLYEGTSYGYDNPRFWLSALASNLVLWGSYLLLMMPFKKVASLSSSALGKTAAVYLAYLLKTLVTVGIVAGDIPAAIELWLIRAPGDATLSIVFWLAFASASTANQDYRLSLQNLNQVSEELEKQRSSRSRVATEANYRLQQIAIDALGSELKKIAEGLKGASEAKDVWRVSAEIKNLISDRVRPLSQDLVRRIDLLSDFKLERSKPVEGWQIRSLRVSPRLDARFGIAYLAGSLNIFVTILQLSDLTAALGVFLVSLSFPLLALVLTRLWSHEARVSLETAVVWGVFATVVAYLPSLWAIHFFSTQHQALEVIRFTAFFVLLFLAQGFSLWATFQRTRDEQLAQVSEYQKQIQRELGLIDQSLWLARRKWAYLIHGTVQGALTVASSRLVFYKDASKQTIDQVLRDIEKARSALTSPIEFKKSTKELTAELQKSWQDICSLRLEISAEVYQRLDQSETGRSCFIEICKELVSNAYRHGKAKHIWLSVFLTEDNNVRLIATDDGAGLGSDFKPGIGFEMFDELTSSWSVEPGAGTKITAVIPLGNPQPASS